jgi:hypothetical protein
VDDPISHTFHGAPRDVVVAGFKLRSQLLGVLSDLNEPEQTGVHQDFVFLQFLLGQTGGMITDKGQIGCDLFEVVSVIFLVIHKS